MKYCCDKFSEQAEHLQTPVGGGMLYPASCQPNAQFEPDDDSQTWNIYGCCGGGCFVVREMRFCPYCGSALNHPGVE